MILLFGPQDDPCLSRVRGGLAGRGVPVTHVDVDDLLARGALSYRVACAADFATLHVGGRVVDLAAVDAALVWRRDLTRLPVEQRTRDRVYAQFEWHAALGGLWELLGTRVLNRRDVAGNTRPHVGEVVRAAVTSGFTLPPLAVSTDLARIGAFAERHGPRTVVSSLSGAFEDACAEDAGHLRTLADGRGVALWGAEAGEWRRIYVVGGATLELPCRDDVDEVPAPAAAPVPIVGERAGRCQRFARALGLDYARILVLRTPAGDDAFYGYSAHLALDPSLGATADALAERLVDLLRQDATTCGPTTPSYS